MEHKNGDTPINELTFEEILFENLKGDHDYFMDMQRIYETAAHMDEERTPEIPAYQACFSHGIGRVFFVKDKHKMLGFAICLDNRRFWRKSITTNDSTPLLKYGSGFVQDLAEIGNFCFIVRIVIHANHRKQGIGTVLVEEIERHYTTKRKARGRDKTSMIGIIVPENNFGFLCLLKKLGYSFINHYRPDYYNHTLCRVVKILDKKKVYKSVSPKTLSKAFRTLIPLQLNSATQDVNNVISRLGAKIIWSAFYQKDEILNKVFDLGSVFMGYYGILFEGGEEKYQSISIPILNKLLTYFDGLKVGSVASLTDALENDAFEMLLLNKDLADISAEKNKDAFSSFFSLVLLDIQTLTLEKLSDIPQLWHKKRLISDKKVYKKFKRLLHNVSHENPITEVEKAEWEDLKIRTILSKEKEDILFRLSQDEKNLSPDGRIKRRADRTKIIESLLYLSHEEIQQWKNWIDLHQSLCKNTQAIKKGDKVWGHAVIPVSFSHGVKRIMFSFVVDRTEDLKFIGNLVQIISSSLAKNMFNILYKLNNTVIKKYLVRDSVSRVMARNMSHNFGSHVLSPISSDDILQHIIDDLSTDIDIQSIARFNAYLRTRMDFLADISTTDPVVSVRRKLGQDIIDKFNKEDIIRNYISGTNLICSEVEFINASQIVSDPQIQVPNGELGNHAFYIIIENIIRNSVKHNWKSNISANNQLKVYVKLEEEEKRGGRFYKCTIYDNAIHQGIPEGEKKNIAQRINEQFINPRIIEKSNEIRSRGWGMLEMKIAAAYLRKISPEKIENNLLLPLLQAVMVPTEIEDSQYHLGFEFYLKKPREILIIDTKDYILDGKEKTRRISYGIRITTPAKLAKEPNNIFSHELVVLLGKQSRKKYEQKKVFPLRWLQIKEIEEIYKLGEILEENPESFIQYVWCKWLGKYAYKKQLPNNLELKCSLNDTTDNLFQTFSLEKVMLYDLHGTTVSSGLGAANGTLQSAYHPDQFFYYEPFGSVQPTGRLLTHLSKETDISKSRLDLELIEAALTEVIIIDERIQEKASNKDSYFENGRFSYIDELRWSKIYIPTREDVDLIDSQYNQKRKRKLCQWIKDKLTTSKIDFIVIHLGLLEKLLGQGGMGIGDFIAEHITKWDTRVEVILTSGRGKPHNISSQIMFLHYSNITQYVIQEKSKYHLCKILFSARTRVKPYA